MATTQPLDFTKVQNYATELFSRQKGKASLRRRYFRQTESIALLLGVNTGLRISDLLGLRWSDIHDREDTIGKYVSTTTSKTGKQHYSALKIITSTLLDEYRTTAMQAARENKALFSREGFVFRNYYSPRPTKTNPRQLFTAPFVRKRLRIAIEKGQLGKRHRSMGLGGHSLRKAYAMRVYEVADLRTASQSLQHTNITNTTRYLKLADKEHEERMNQIAELL